MRWGVSTNFFTRRKPPHPCQSISYEPFNTNNMARIAANKEVKQRRGSLRRSPTARKTGRFLDEIQMPEHLSPDEEKIFIELFELFNQEELIVPIDALAIEQIVGILRMNREAYNMLKADGFQIVRQGSKGKDHLVRSPYAIIFMDTSKQLDNWFKSFGITPGARARLNLDLTTDYKPIRESKFSL